MERGAQPDRERQSPHRAFLALERFAVVGNSDLRPFPRGSCDGLRRLGKKVYPVDLGGSRYVGGDEAFPALEDLPEPVEGVVIDLPRHLVAAVVRQAADRGLRDLWVEPPGECPEAQALGAERGLRIHTGIPLAVYTGQGFSYHTLQRWVAKLLGKY